MSEVTIYEPKFTQIPNSVISIMPQLSEAEFKVIMAVCRKTFGFHKKRDRISYSQMEKLTGMSRSSISKALKSEILRTIIRVHETPKGNEFEPIITPNTENEGSTKSELPGGEVVQNLNYISTESELPASTESEHTKENSTKETKQNKYGCGDLSKWDGQQPVDYASFVNVFNLLYQQSLRVTDKKREMIRARLRTFTGEEIKLAWHNRLEDRWLNGDGAKYLGNWKAAMRNDEKIDRYLHLETEDDSDILEDSAWRR